MDNCAICASLVPRLSGDEATSVCGTACHKQSPLSKSMYAWILQWHLCLPKAVPWTLIVSPLDISAWITVFYRNKAITIILVNSIDDSCFSCNDMSSAANRHLASHTFQSQGVWCARLVFCCNDVPTWLYSSGGHCPIEQR